MRILFVTRSLNCGGAERQLVALAKGLHERGHIVGVAVFYPGGELEHDLRESSVSIYSLDKKTRWNTFPLLYRLVKLVNRTRPDILHGYLPVPNIIVLILKHLISHAVMVVWGVRASNVDLKDYDWLTRSSYWLECRLSRFADLIIVNSNAGAHDAITRGFPSSKMVVVPNGIDTSKFHPDLDAGQRVRAEWKIADDQRIIGIVARLHPMKDHETFLKAAAQIARVLPNVRFVVVGDGPIQYRTQLQALGESLGLGNHLIWAGLRTDMPAVYNALNMVVSSSKDGEGFPNVIGEAMACGVPCLVTDVGDSSLIVGSLGQVVMPRDPRGLASGLKSVLSGDLMVDPQELRRQIIDSHSHEALIRATEKTLKGICSR